MSSSKDLVSYLATRFPASRFVPLSVFLAAAGLVQSPPGNISPWLVAAGLALILVLLFRLCDDIADREHDRRTHPERVLCNRQNINSYLSLTAILFVFNGLALTWLHDSYFKPLGYLVLCAYLFAWYRFRPVTSPPGHLNSHMVLLKYPVIAWLISTPPADSDRALYYFSLLSVYLIFIVFEILDDHNLRQLPRAKISLIANLLLLTGVWVLIALLNRSYTSLAFGTAWVFIVLTTIVLGVSGLASLKKHSVTRNRQGFFIVGLLAYLAIAMEKSL